MPLHIPVYYPSYNHLINRLTRHFLLKNGWDRVVAVTRLEKTHTCHVQAILWWEKWMGIITTKKNIFTDSWGQLVSQGEVLVARALHREAFVILWMLIRQLPACFKGTQAIMFSSAPFPSRWPKFSSLTIRLPICLVWLLTMSRDVVVFLQLQREEDGGCPEGKSWKEGETQRLHLAYLWKDFFPGRLFVYTIVP